MNCRFNRKEAKVLIWDANDKHDPLISDCNNQEQVDWVIKKRGEPDWFVNNFTNWQELVVYKRCFLDMCGKLAQEQPDRKPTDSECEWFMEKDFTDMYPWDQDQMAEKLAIINAAIAELPDYYGEKNFISVG